MATGNYQMEANSPTDGVKNAYQRVVQQTLEDMNTVLLESGLFISQLGEQDRRWQKGRKNGHTLNWRSLLKFYDSTALKAASFVFVFRWIAAPLTRAGFCLCHYHRVDNLIELVALESFTGRAAKHPLSGKMLEHCLRTLYFYGVNLRAQGLIPTSLPNILISNVLNNRLLELYTSQASFTVIPGTMNCITDFIALRKYIRHLKKFSVKSLRDKVCTNNVQKGEQHEGQGPERSNANYSRRKRNRYRNHETTNSLANGQSAAP